MIRETATKRIFPSKKKTHIFTSAQKLYFWCNISTPLPNFNSSEFLPNSINALYVVFQITTERGGNDEGIKLQERKAAGL